MWSILLSIWCQDVLIPHVAENWHSYLLVDEIAAKPGTLLLVLLDDNGGEVLREELRINARESLKLDLSGRSAASGRIESVTGEMYFRVAYEHPSEGGVAEYPLGVAPSANLLFPYSHFKGMKLTWKGLALLHSGQERVDALLTAFDRNGNTLGSQVLALEPWQRERLVLAEFFDLDLGLDQVARVECRSSGRLHGIAMAGVDNGRLLFSLALPLAELQPAREEFVPDPGFRLDRASNVAPSVREDGTVVLYFQEDGGHRQLLAESQDGLQFGLSREPEHYRDDPRLMRLHEFGLHGDLVWKRFTWNMAGASLVMTSLSSRDGIHFISDQGHRYTAPAEDYGAIGVFDCLRDRSGGVVMLYIGDMHGAGAGVRRAYSADGGWTFTFDRTNVLGDLGLPHGERFVDQKSIRLPDGRIRLFTMRQGVEPPLPGQRKVGEIFSFISEDDGVTFSLEPGPCLTPGDFPFDVWSLNDPWVVCLPDGRYRMYVTALVGDPAQGTKQVIVSASTSKDI